MEQIADHDQLNIINQLNGKWEYLDSMLARVSESRNSNLKDVVYNLSVEAKSTDFDKLYLVMENGRIYNNSYLETDLEKAPWKKAYQQAGGLLCNLLQRGQQGAMGRISALWEAPSYFHSLWQVQDLWHRRIGSP